MLTRKHGKSLMVLLFAAGTVAACSEKAAPTSPSQGAISTESPAVQGNNAGQSGLAAVRQATAAFHDIKKAVAAGYLSPIGGRCVASPAGAMGVHSVNPLLVQNPALDPEAPEALLYVPTGGGNYRLVGVEYIQPVLLRNTATNQIAPWFPQSPWPASYVVVNQVPSLFGQTFQGPMRGHEPGTPWHYDLHVWLWSPNPDGMFAQWNPSLTCE